MKSNYWELREEIFNRQVRVAETQIAKELRRLEAKTANDVKALYAFLTSGNDNILISDVFKYQQYYTLLNSLQENLLATGNKEISILEKSMRDLYITNTQLVADEISFNIPVDEEKIIKAIRSQWVGDGKIYSDRIWGNNSVLRERIQSGLIDALIRGDSVDKVAGMLERDFDVSYRNAQRLVRTELSYIQNKSAADGYEEAGYTYYEFSNVGDDDVCDGLCEELNGKIFPFSEATPGENFPPIHPFAAAGFWQHRRRKQNPAYEFIYTEVNNGRDLERHTTL